MSGERREGRMDGRKAGMVVVGDGMARSVLRIVDAVPRRRS